MDCVEIDGAMGEGGGQVLRSSLTLALLSGKPLHIHHIRRNRRRPGLQPQHLAAVRAAAAISAARVVGMVQGSQELSFIPGPVLPGRYEFDIGTAGASGLVLQTVYLPLAFAGGSSQVLVHGGTHVPLSPCYHYLERQWCPMLEHLGIHIRLHMLRAGFWPPGGGLIQATIRPSRSVRALDLCERGPLLRIEGLSAAACLPVHVAERQRDQALRRLRSAGFSAHITTECLQATSPGTVLLLLMRFQHTQACFFALGARGKPAERVADEAVDEALGFLCGDGAVDAYLADQLLLPLAIAASSSRLRTAAVTTHLTTHAEVIRRFLPCVSIVIEGASGQPGTIHISPACNSPLKRI